MVAEKGISVHFEPRVEEKNFRHEDGSVLCLHWLNICFVLYQICFFKLSVKKQIPRIYLSLKFFLWVELMLPWCLGGNYCSWLQVLLENSEFIVRSTLFNPLKGIACCVKMMMYTFPFSWHWQLAFLCSTRFSYYQILIIIRLLQNFRLIVLILKRNDSSLLCWLNICYPLVTL